MGLLKIVLAVVVLLAPICKTHQTDMLSEIRRMKSSTITRTHRQVPSYLLDLYNQGSSDNGTVIRAFFSEADDDCYGDSCYSFYGEGEKWTENRQECKDKGGDLVSIETEGEWTFLKDKIQGLCSLPKDEWHIGLKKEASTWKWVNGAPLKLDKWQVSEGQPSGDGPYVVMAKDFPKGTQGLFNDIPDSVIRGYICETTKDVPENLFSFNLMAIQPSEKIQRASLRIFKRPSKLTEQQGNFEITVSLLMIPWKKEDPQEWKKELVKVVTKSVAWRKEGEWVDLDVTSAAKYWNKYKSKNYGLWVSVRGQGVPSSDFKVAKGGQEDPFLVAFGIDENKRQKGSEEEEDDDARNEAEGADEDASLLQSPAKTKTNRAGSTRSTSTSCRLHSLTIDIHRDLNLGNWIIAPRHLKADYCKGTCSYSTPINRGSKPTSHAYVQSLLALINTKVPTPCCAPTKLKGMSVLSYDNSGSVKLGTWKLLPASCGCL